MKKYDFSFTGGFPLEQEVLDDMQSAFTAILKSFVGFMKIPETGSHILFGCKVVGPNITSGIMYIDGDLCHFTGVSGTLTTKIAKLITPTNLPFESGVNNPALLTITAVVDAAGEELQNFTSYGDQLVFDANYVHTENNFSDLDLAHLDSIEPGAQVNVIPSWTALVGTPKFIEDKPLFLDILRIDDAYLANFPNPSSGSTASTTITFPDLGTDEYWVFATLKSLSSIGAAGQDIVPIATSSYTSTSFKILAKEFDTDTKNNQLNYIIVKIP